MFSNDPAINAGMAENSEQPKSLDDQKIVVFDAECILCSANAQFVLKYDRGKHFMLAAMQGDYGSALYQKYGIDPTNPETLILLYKDKLLRNSDAVLAIYEGLGWPWKLAIVARIIPKFLRDPIYLFVARNRYRIFGKRDSCWLPTPEYQDRML